MKNELIRNCWWCWKGWDINCGY